MRRIQKLVRGRHWGFTAFFVVGAGVSATRADAAMTAADADNRVQALLVSVEAETRALAFSTGRRWIVEDGGRERYLRVLWSAWQRQERGFAAAVRDGASSVGLFANSYRNWKTLSGDAMSKLQSGMGRSGDALAQLDQRYTLASQARIESDARLGVALNAVQRISAVGNGLVEIERELVALGARNGSAPPVRDRLAANTEGRVVLAAERTLLAARNARDSHIEATLHNREQGWAPGTVRRFASLLNGRRHALGLEPLRLEPRLSEACAMHAAEMKRLGYFDHLSPEPERRTPDQRAEIAKFEGDFEGENLYQSATPEAPEKVLRSWWASDAHRLVLYSPDPNHLGLDPGGGTHWALMTGRL